MPIQPLTIVFFSANAGGIANLSHACQQMKSNSLTVLGRSAEDLRQEKQVNDFLKLIQEAERLVLLIRLHGGKASCPCFDKMVEAAGISPIYIDAQNEEDIELSKECCANFGSSLYRDIVAYMRYDGKDNWLNLLKVLLGLPADPPYPQPTEGLYHPRLGVVTDLKTYLAKLGTSHAEIMSGTRPVIGVWFFPIRFSDSDIAHINALVTEIEQQEALPICCFYRRSSMPGMGAKGTQWIRDNFFCINGQPVIHVLINLMCFSLSLIKPKEAHLMGELNIPILHAMELYADYETWSGSHQGVSPLDVSASFAQPEFDGYLSSVPIATRERNEKDMLTGAFVPRLKPIPDRIAKVVRMARNWALLKIKPNHEKKVAIIFHNYPPRNDMIGTAIGLDTFQSVYDLLMRLKQEGYSLEKIYEDTSSLAEQVVSGLTCDRRWLIPEVMSQRAVGHIPSDKYDIWYDQLPEKNKTHMAGDWGKSPGSLFVYEGQVMINGVLNGNIYIGVQPPRGHIEQKDRIHDPDLSPSYHYIYYYRWLRDIFKADAVIHVGTHGSLEWLPGKSAGMSRTCYPDLAIGELPNIYPYIINIPSEGTQTKRRTFSCLIDHMIPVMTNAGLYENLAELDVKILEYLQTKETNPSAIPVIGKQIWEIIEKANLHKELQISKNEFTKDLESVITKIQGYLSELADSAITYGLHTLGRPPEGDGLVELITQILRLKNGSIPSLRETVAKLWGYDLKTLLEKRGEADPTGRYMTYAQALESIHKECIEIVKNCIAGNSVASQWHSDEMDMILAFIKEFLLPKLNDTQDEIQAIINALDGGFVPSGGSGNPTRGQVDILPTGRNFYSVDPEKMPTPTAWEIGVLMAKKLIKRYVQDTGKPLETMGIVLWGSNEFRNYGEDIAQALYLMGVKPVWEARNGRVVGMEIIPSSELDNPRVDITFRISGFFRDGLPNIVEMLDDAVLMVSTLKETYDSNILRANILKEKEELIKQGFSPDEAFREARFRIYSCPSGTYGAGVSEAIHASAWETSDDLGEVFVNWGGYAYGKGVYGIDRRENFRKRLTKMQVVVKNEDNREHDLFSSDDFNSFFGGFIAAVNKESGVQPNAYSGDSSNPELLCYRTVSEEVKHIFRTRLLNPKWIDSMMDHGFKGAGDLSRTVDLVFAWDATSQVIDGWMYQSIAEKYAIEPGMKEWLLKVNPHALQNISERLLEAIHRNMWDADEKMKKELEELYLEVEGDIEEFSE